MSDQNYIEHRPWGSYEILSRFPVSGEGLTDSCIKKIIVKPRQRLSYQSHKQRNEHWFVVQGVGEVLLDGQFVGVKVGSSVDIPIGVKHRVTNTAKDADLIFIESQTGHYDEADIERFEDDYGRV